MRFRPLMFPFSPRRAAGLGLLLALSMCAGGSARAATAPQVRVEPGVLRGVDVGGGIAAFKGIPFAQPPVAALRWRPPAAPKSWPGVYEAAQFKPACMQKTQGVVDEIGPVAEGIGAVSEDCLYLNVWRPAGSPKTLRPVMVWIYGGAFKYGAGSVPMYDGTQLARDGVVVVTLNYRMGVFGFLAHPELTAESPQHSSGNYGLLDQLAALRWVHDNVRAFGGDPSRVTVFGQSAGASSIAYLMLSPQAQGLFQRAILESPAIFRPLASLQAAEADGQQALGSDIAALRKMPAEALLKRNEAFAVKPNRAAIGPRTIGPIVDGWVLKGDETESYADGGGMRIPLMIGGNTDEGWLFVRNWTIRSVPSYRRYLEKNFSADANQAAFFWPVTQDDDALHAVSALNGDLHFQYGIRQFSRLLAKAGVPVYRYNFTRRAGGTGPAPTHEDEINYVFGHIPATGDEYNDDDRRLSADMQKMWVSFASDAVPDSGTQVRWPLFNATRDDAVQLDVPLAVQTQLRASQLDFVSRFYHRVLSSAPTVP